MKRDDTRKNLTPLSGNDLKTVPLHYPSFPCIIAIVTISEVFCFMRYHSVLNAELHLFCSENRNFCIIIIFLVFSCSLQKGRLPWEVNPFVGTGFHGHTYPGATVPFGAVQLSPDTRKSDWDACAGYHYSDSLISGFSHTHLSGTGCIDFGDILVYPASRTLSPEQGGNWLSPLPFSHRQEWASPGYYKVMLPTEGIQAELTATPYTGVHRYRFTRTGEVSVVLSLIHI